MATTYDQTAPYASVREASAIKPLFLRSAAFRVIAVLLFSGFAIAQLAPDLITPFHGGHFSFLVVRQALVITAVIVAAALLLLRPSSVTWCLYLYSFAAVRPAAILAGSAFAHSSWYMVANWSEIALSAFALVLLAMGLAERPTTRYDGVLVLAGAVLALGHPIVNIGALPQLHWWPGVQQPWLVSTITVVYYAFIAGLLARTYARAEEQMRAGLQWVIAAVLVVAAIFVADVFLFPAHWTYAQHVLVGASPIIVFTAAAYPLLRSRIVDITFAVSRLLVYAILAGLIAGVLLAVSNPLERNAGALLIGIMLPWLYRHIDAAVDRFIFRGVSQRASTFTRMITALPHAKTREIVDSVLADGAAQTLDLASAGVFHRMPDGGFVRTAEFGWPDVALRTFDAGHRLTMYLCTANGPIVPEEAFDTNAALSLDAARPSLAVPFIARGELIGFVLYGSHRNGAQPDSKDVALLSDLVRSASVAYDEIAMRESSAEMTELRADMEMLQSHNALLRSLLGEVTP